MPAPIATTDIVLPFKATVVPWRATVAWLNLALIGVILFAIGMLVFVLRANYLIQAPVMVFIVPGLLLVAFIVALVIQVWAMYTLSIEVTDFGLRERAAYQDRVIAWDKIQAIKFDDWKCQVTIWMTGKRTYMKYFGFHPTDVAKLKAVIRTQMQARHIEIQ